MKFAPVQQLVDALSDALLPPPALLVSEWARKKFRLSTDYSAIHGDFEPHPFQVEPLDVLSPHHPADTMVLMCAAQMMKTLIMLIFLGYVIDVDPGPALIVQPSESDADSFSKERIAPMIRDVPSVAAKVVAAKSRDSGNTILQKRFRGGMVSLTGAVSPRGLRRRSVRFLMLDEVDGYDQTSEGDPVSLARMRTVTYWNRKIVLSSTPTTEGASRIATAFHDSDQRRFNVPCPFCGELQVLVWANVRWGKVGDRQIEAADAHYQCSGCDELIPHHRKTEMLRAGEWIAENPAGRFPGFQISRLYAPDWSWGRIVVEEFLPKQASGDLKAFVNTILAETWKEKGEAPDHEKLMARREESYRLGDVPPGVLFLTAGIDVQKTWIEGYVYGWGRGKTRWVIDHFRVEKSPYAPGAFEELEERLSAVYRTESGVNLSIVRVGIDTGHATQEVYRWAKQQGSSRVLALDGRSTGAALIGAPSPVEITVGGRKIKTGVKLWPVNVSMAKSELYGLLGKERPGDGEPYPAGWVHFPADLDEEFFLQLTAEQLVTRIVKGYRKTEWIKTRDRNEALDCANYARAAASHYGIDRFQEARWAAFEAQLGIRGPERATEQPQQSPANPEARLIAQTQPPPPPARNDWLGGRGTNWFRR